MKHIKLIFDQFDTNSTYLSAEPFGNGYINDTYKITAKNGKSNVGFVLQKINSRVFHNIVGLMDNIELVSKYILEQGNGAVFSKSMLTNTGNNFFCEILTNNCWRMYDYIEDSFTYEYITDPVQFYEAGRAFGLFQYHLKEFDSSQLVETIVNFHNTPRRLEKFLISVNKDVVNRKRYATKEINYLKEMSHLSTIITALLDEQTIPLRVAHNDTKLNNVLFCGKTKKALSVIDLDTIMPGTLLYDFGDAIRYGANKAAEDERDLKKVGIDLNLFKVFTQGFLESTISFITPDEVKYLADSVMVLTYELSLRFLTDFLSGDVYFKTKSKYHNLIRARSQIALLKDLEKNYEEMKLIVDSVYSQLI